MKQVKLLLVLTLTSFLFSNAQTDSAVAKPWKTPFKRGYIRLGIDKLGGNLNTAVAPAENIHDGNFGAGYGYTLEFGHIFYFLDRKKQRIYNVGLDWTIISLAYNPLDKWKDYASQRNENVDMGTSFHASVASKLGPVVTVNPVSKLVIEARFQLTYALHYSPFEYFAEKENNQSYDFWFDDENYFDTRGIGTNIGATIRYGFIGLAVDLSNAKIPTVSYLSQNGQQETSNTEKIPYKHFQVKVNLTF
ncbi:MAG: hypothetical protein KF746_02130 [Chitinophagaceae bacterium]|nr:hypothetical protein [Chitinophagaceae bacterium]